MCPWVVDGSLPSKPRTSVYFEPQQNSRKEEIPDIPPEAVTEYIRDGSVPGGDNSIVLDTQSTSQLYRSHICRGHISKRTGHLSSKTRLGITPTAGLTVAEFPGRGKRHSAFELHDDLAKPNKA